MNIKKISLTSILLFVFLFFQIVFWNITKEKKPEWTVSPEVPSARMVNAMAFGDKQFLFRVLCFYLQNAGDSGGRFSSLTKYDYSALEKWFYLLDELDSESNYTAAMAAYYYGVTPKTKDVRHVVSYLRSHTRKNPAKKWRWLAHAAYLAKHRIKDEKLALEIAKELAGLDVSDMPLWTRQMPAFIMADMGDKEAARTIMMVIMGTIPDLPEAEIRFMQNYIKHHLGDLKQKEKAK